MMAPNDGLASICSGRIVVLKPNSFLLRRGDQRTFLRLIARSTRSIQFCSSVMLPLDIKFTPKFRPEYLDSTLRKRMMRDNQSSVKGRSSAFSAFPRECEAISQRQVKRKRVERG